MIRQIFPAFWIILQISRINSLSIVDKPILFGSSRLPSSQNSALLPSGLPSSQNSPNSTIEDHPKLSLENDDLVIVNSKSEKFEEYSHEELYDRNHTLVDIPNFKFVINNDICNVQRVALVTIIHTAVDNHEARSMIRSSWGNPDIPGVVTKLVFLLGYPEDERKQEKIQEENEENRDIVQGDFLDTYHNLSYKAIMGNLWVSEYCDKAEFVVKTDDDMFVDLYEVYHLTRKHLTSAHYMKDRFLLCPVWYGLPILRDPTSKWYASYEQWPKMGEEGEEFYPTSCSGWLWITSPGTSQAISEAAQDVPFFWIDDVWLTGSIAQHLQIEHQDVIQYWTMTSKQLLLHKAVQSPRNYFPDYISGPMDRDRSLTMALQSRARWCYENKCKNNIYSEHPPTEASENNYAIVINKFFSS